MISNYVIETQGLTKAYGDCVALNDITLQLKPGKIYGLLGRNGAGKTTLLNVLTARIFQSFGQAQVFGERIYENIDVLKQICFIEEKGFYASTIKVREVLKLASSLYPNWSIDYAKNLLELFELDEKKKYKQLSRGMESTLGLIIGLASRAPLTIFDEPSLGLDAVVRERFYDELLRDIERHPRTVIISTHLIDEVSRLFEDIIIMDDGKVLLESNADALRECAYYISGKAQAVREAAKDCITLSQEEFGGTLILSVYSKTKLAAGSEVEIQKMPLQKLFVQLINPNIQENLRKGGITQ